MKGESTKFTDQDLERLWDLDLYLTGLRSLVRTDLCDDEVILNRQELHALILPAWQKVEKLYCDLQERMTQESRGKRQASVTPIDKGAS
jgi:hypothetical protein